MEQKINNNVVYVEKLDNVPGIYVIYNKSKRGIYIGQAEHLKIRASEHVKYLFKNDKSGNVKLRNDFNDNIKDEYYIRPLKLLKKEDSLDYWESIFYCAANRYIKESEYQKLYNKVNLEKKLERINYKDKTDKEKDIDDAIVIINEVLNKKLNKKSMGKFTKDRYIMQDWISEETISALGLKRKNLKKMFDDKEIEFLLFSVAGDYIGKERTQSIDSILIEKNKDIRTKSKCLWVTSGPEIPVFKRFIKTFKDRYDNKKLFALFKFTISKYNQDKLEEKHFYYEKDGVVYKGTGAIRLLENNYKIYTCKAFLINKFYIVNEYFDFQELQEKYYRAINPTLYVRGNNAKYELNSDNWSRITSYPGVSKSLLIEEGNDDVKKLVGLLDKEYLLEELKEREKINYVNTFPDCEDEHAVYYVLAEIEDYVEAKSKKSEECKNDKK